MISIAVKPCILLTGAGFTKNCGGFLAEEMWNKIYNNPQLQESPVLRSRLQDDPDYESLYTELLADKGLSEEEKGVFVQALHDAYQKMDESIRNWSAIDDPDRFDTYGLRDLLGMFGGTPTHRGLIFTLNQDLFLERQIGCVYPGIPQWKSWLGDHRQERLTPKDYLNVGWTNQEDFQRRVKEDTTTRGGFLYIKLHGSYGWKASGTLNQLVIGKAKESAIQSNPILARYFDLLTWAVSLGGRRVFIIGYSFSDKHVNRILADAVRNHGLELYVIDKKPLQEIKAFVKQHDPDSLGMFDNWLGHWPYTLKDIFPPNQRRSQHCDEILKVLEPNKR